MLKRLSLITLTLTTLVAATVAAPAGAVVIGIGDNSPAMFHDARFNALAINESRVTVPWDVVTLRADRSLLGAFTTWLRAAEADHVTPLVSFNADSGRAGNIVPSTSTYQRAVKAFIRKFPEIHRYTAWNEPDWPYRSLARNPALAAGYFNTLVDVCQGCTVLAGDVYLPTSGPARVNGALATLGPWLTQYRRYLHHNPRQWALHDYYDSRTRTDSQLVTMLRLTQGSIWLDESGGIESRGHWPYPDQSARAAAADESYLLGLARRFPRISRIYHYQWKASPHAGWDSGLISLSGAERPAYNVLLGWLRQHTKRRRAHHRGLSLPLGL